MHYRIFTESDRLIETLPDEGNAQVVWAAILVILFAAYWFTARTRRRAAEHHLAAKRREQELRDNDPDMRKDQ
jgi:hypothetical protein